MARKLVVEVVADATQFLRSMKASSAATTSFSTDLKQLGVSSEVAAKAQVAAAVKTTESLRIQAVEYRRLAAAAAHGSEEQIAAARLAADAERKLAASLGTTAHEAGRLGRESAGLERSLGRATRGALTGSGIMRGFGRSLVFASGGFLAFQGVTEFLRSSVDAAREAAVGQRSLAAQMKASSESFQANREQIEKVANSYSRFGFDNDKVLAGLTVLERGTGSLTKSFGLLQLTADLARARQLTFAGAATVVAKVFGGQETALRRAVPGLAKNAHGYDLIREAQAKLAGQAAANTTQADKFAAALYNTEQIVGTALLPILNKYLDSLTKWLQKMDESGQLQKDAASAAKFLGDAFAVAKTGLDVLKGAFEKLNKITGSTKHSLELLFGAFVVFKTAKFASTILDIVGSMGKLRTATKLATTEQEALNAAQAGGRFARLGPAAVAAAAVGVLVYGATRPKSATYGAKQQYSKVGNKYYRIVPTRAGGPQRVEVSADEYYAATGKTPPPQAMPSRTPLDPRRFFPTPSVALGAAAGRPLSLQGRFNLAELRLAQAQLTKTQADDRRILVVEQAITAQQIKQAKSLKDRIQLTQQLGGIVGQIRGIDQQAADAVKQQAQNRKDAAKAVADAAKAAKEAAKARRSARLQTGLDWLDFGLEKAQATKKVGDDVAAEKKIIAHLKDMVRQTGLTVDLARQIFEHRQALAGLMKQKAGPQKTLLQAGFQYSGFAPGVLPPMLRPSAKPLPLPPALQLPAGKPTVVINGGLHLHGVHDVPALESELLKRSTTRPQTRRGRR